MKKLTEQFNESFESGVSAVKLGLMNHYTPIDNIVINVRNIFGALLGLVVTKGEDGVSLKITSSSFTNPETTESILYNSTFDGHTYLYSYIMNQGLRGMKILQLGANCVAYFYPTDLAGDICPGEKRAACEEMLSLGIGECEMFAVNEGASNEFEIEDRSKEELAEIINMQDKVKAATAFADKMSSVVKLPETMYVKATKDADGHESISLRYKTARRRPFGGSVEQVTSLINIYSTGNNGVWVDAYLTPSMYDEDVLDTVDAVLQFLGAKSTNDDAVWNIPDENVRTEAN